MAITASSTCLVLQFVNNIFLVHTGHYLIFYFFVYYPPLFPFSALLSLHPLSPLTFPFLSLSCFSSRPQSPYGHAWPRAVRREGQWHRQVWYVNETRRQSLDWPTLTPLSVPQLSFELRLHLIWSRLKRSRNREHWEYVRKILGHYTLHKTTQKEIKAWWKMVLRWIHSFWSLEKFVLWKLTPVSQALL